MNAKEFQNYLDSLKESTTTRGHSSGVAAEVTANILNTPDFQMPSYKEDGKGSVETTTTTPIADFRDATASVVGKAMGLDRAETAALSGKLDFTKSYGEAFNNAADAAEAAYLSTGRAKVKPQIGDDISRVSVRLETVPEKVEETTKIVQKADGTYESVPTGNVVTTKEHRIVKAKNTTRAWMKDIKKK